MSRAALTALVTGAAFAGSPAIATATTWCVQDPSCPAGGNSSQTTIQGAGTAAASTGDTILIGPGKFMEAVNLTGKSIDLIGAGSAQTVIQSPTPGTTTFERSRRSLPIPIPGTR